MPKRLYLKFSEPEDLALYERLEKDAKKQRYDVQTYIMLVLLQAYPEPDITEERKRELMALASSSSERTDTPQTHHSSTGASD